MSDTDTAGVIAMLERYFDVLHDGDPNTLRALFLPECDLICALSDGSYSHMTFEAYEAAVSARIAPKTAGHPRHGRILMIDRNGPDLALAKVDSAVPPRFFRDYLTLVRHRGEWRIASKIYHVLPGGD